MIQARDEDRITSEAMDWVLRRDEGALSRTETEAFEAWLARSPRHREAFASTESFWGAAAQLGSHPQMPDTRRWALAGADRGRLTRRAIAAGFAALVVGAGALTFLRLNEGPRPLVTQAFSTAVGQQATVSLPDGSTVTLNTDTRVRTVAHHDRRLVYLDKGQAFFKVAKDPRHPFVVTAGGRTVTALGTAFEVRVDKGAFKVVLVEGRVRVEAARPVSAGQVAPASAGPSPARPIPQAPAPISTDMSAGSQLVASNDADWRVTRTNAVQETSWTKGQLIFDDERLGDVVTELNRYTPRKMVFADARLAERRISGVYTPGDLQGFVYALRTGKVADVREDGDGEIQIIEAR